MEFINYETVQWIVQILSGALIVPIVSWLKKRLPTDFPIQQVFIVTLLNFGVVLLIDRFLPVTLTYEQMITLALAGQVVSQYVHGFKKNTEEATYKEKLKSDATVTKE